MSDANLELAQRYQEKFAFYVIALTFTVLGLAIQTASFDETTLPGALEIVAWFLLLISGLAGLYRIGHVPHLFFLSSEAASYKTQLSELQKLALKGETEMYILQDERKHQISEQIDLARKSVEAITRARDDFERFQLGISYYIQATGFLLGLFFLMAARSYKPILQIFCHA